MTDTRLEIIIGNLLRAGVSLAAATVLAGGLWYLSESGGAPPHYRRFHPDARGLPALFSLPKPEALIFLGLLLLIATPIARVAFSLVAFALERDRLYVFFTLVVLVLLLYSLGTSWL